MREGSVSVRLNPFKGCAGPEGAVVPWNRYGRILSERPVFTLDPLFHAGCYYVQDSSAMFVGHLFRQFLPQLAPGCRVLDLCAAPGGKTTDIAASLREAFGSDFELVSNEVMKGRAQILCDNVSVWGDPCVTVTSVDPAIVGRALPGWFDVIVADVPCSGEGMFRKDPRAEKEWSEATVDLCAARQKRILADVWPALKEGGILVYSTCTYEDAENDSNLEWAASELGGEIVQPEDVFEDYGVRRTRSGNILKVGEVPGEGQWAGALVKTSPAKSVRGLNSSALRPLRRGLSKGVQKGKDFVPDSDYALSLDYDRSEYPVVEVGRDLALKFLHRDSFVLPEAPKGYVAIAFQGHPLGFVKNLGNRCNNLLPQRRKILMDVQ